MFSKVAQKVKTLLNQNEMETLTSKQEEAVNWLMAEEFLRNRLGVKTTKENIGRFVAHMVAFEKEVKGEAKKQEAKQCLLSKSMEWMNTGNVARVSQ